MTIVVFALAVAIGISFALALHPRLRQLVALAAGLAFVESGLGFAYHRLAIALAWLVVAIGAVLIVWLVNQKGARQ